MKHQHKVDRSNLKDHNKVDRNKMNKQHQATATATAIAIASCNATLSNNNMNQQSQRCTTPQNTITKTSTAMITHATKDDAVPSVVH